MTLKKEEVELLEACRLGDTSRVRALLKLRRMNVNIQEFGTGNTPLIRACLGGFRGIVRLLLNDERVKVNVRNKVGRTAFCCACEKGDVEIVKNMIAHEGVDVNLADNNGHTPLILSSKWSLFEVIEWILSSNLEVNIESKDKNGASALGLSRQWNQSKIVDLLESYQKDSGKTRRKLQKELGFYCIFHFSIIFISLIYYFFYFYFILPLNYFILKIITKINKLIIVSKASDLCSLIVLYSDNYFNLVEFC